MPVALVHHLKHNRVLHERLLLVCVVTLEEPRVDDADRVEVIPIGDGISRVILRSGFMETSDVKEGVKLAIAQGKLMDVNPTNLTYYIGRETIVPTERPGMVHWREVLPSMLGDTENGGFINTTLGRTPAGRWSWVCSALRRETGAVANSRSRRAARVGASSFSAREAPASSAKIANSPVPADGSRPEPRSGTQ